MSASVLEGYRAQLVDGLYPTTASLGDAAFGRNLYIVAGLCFLVSALHIGYIGARVVRRREAPLWLVRKIERPTGSYRVPHASVSWVRRCRRSIDLTRQAIAAIVGFALFGVGWLTMAIALQSGQGSATLWIVSTIARTLAVTWIFCFVWPALASYCAS